MEVAILPLEAKYCFSSVWIRVWVIVRVRVGIRVTIRVRVCVRARDELSSVARGGGGGPKPPPLACEVCKIARFWCF